MNKRLPGLTLEDLEWIESFARNFKAAAEIVRENDPTLANTLLFQAGFAIGTLHKLDQRLKDIHEHLAPPPLPRIKPICGYCGKAAGFEPQIVVVTDENDVDREYGVRACLCGEFNGESGLGVVE